MKFFRYLLLLLFLGLLFGLNADDFYNIHELFGERASSMGGAYSAISDDVSGAFYNPGGLAFSHNDSISVNASSYKINRVAFRGIFGPFQDYIVTSRNYLPNFVGVLKSYNNNLKFALSVLNNQADTFYQSNHYNLPVYAPEIASFNVNFTQEKFEILVGPSASYKLSEKLSVGVTVYSTGDSYRSIFNVQQELKTGHTNANNTLDRIRNTGLLPILGIQYMLTDKLSTGFSIRKKFYNKPHINNREYLVSSMSLIPQEYEMNVYSIYSEGNSKYSIQTIGAGYEHIILSPIRAGYPQRTEIRGGFAWFASPRFLLSLDIIYTEGYRKMLNNFSYYVQAKMFSYNRSDYNPERRQDTLNYSIGTEAYITDNVVLRLGAFTNFSNNDKVSWLQGALNMIRESKFGTSYKISDSLEYIIPKRRDEYVNLLGYTVGLGYVTPRGSISIGLSHSIGRGIGTLTIGKLPQIMEYHNVATYFTATTSY